MPGILTSVMLANKRPVPNGASGLMEHLAAHLG